MNPEQLILALMGLIVLSSALLDNEAIARSKAKKVLSLGVTSVACGVVFFYFTQPQSVENTTLRALNMADLLFLRHATWGSGFVAIGYAFIAFSVLAPLIRWWKRNKRKN